MLSEPVPLPTAMQKRLERGCPAVSCELHIVSLGETALAAYADSRWLTTEDRHRAARFLRPAHARRWSRARAALRELLAERIGATHAAAPFSTGAAGKPRPGGDSAWRFSVSHSHDVALIACAQGVEPGVDIERIGIERDIATLVRTVFSVEEIREFEALRDEPGVRANAFIRVWTRKEAVVKSSGEGIGFGLTRLDVGIGDVPRLSTDGEPELHRILCDVPAPAGYSAALCLLLPMGDQGLPAPTHVPKSIAADGS